MDVRIFAKYIIGLGLVLLLIGGFILGNAALEAKQLREKSWSKAVDRLSEANKRGGYYGESTLVEMEKEKAAIAEAEARKPTGIWVLAGGAVVLCLGFGLRAAARKG